MLLADHSPSPPDNHKPTLSSDIAPTSAKLKSSSSSSSSSSNPSYDLSFTDDGGKYAYSGSRSTKENQYALIFDPERKAFVLHRVDSTFNMNLTRTPSDADADALKEEYPHLDNSIRVAFDNKKGGSGSGGGAAARGGSGKGKGKGSAARNAGMVESKRGGSGGVGSRSAPSSSSSSKAKATADEPARDEKKKKKTVEVATKPKPRDRSPEGSEDEYSEGDGGLLVEYPEAQTSAASSFNRPQHHHQHQQQRQQQQQHQQQQQSSAEGAPTGIRRFSEFMANQAADDESDEDADAEYDEEDLLVEDEAGDSSAGDGFKLPSPVGRSNGGQNVGGAGHGGDADAEGEDDNVPEDDELMAMLEEEMAEGGEMDVDSESSVSEED